MFDDKKSRKRIIYRTIQSDDVDVPNTRELMRELEELEEMIGSSI